MGGLFVLAMFLAAQGWTHAIGGGELLNVLSGRIASTPQDPSFNPVLGYIQNLHLFRHAIYSPRPLYQTVFVDFFGTSAVPFHVVAFIYSYGSSVFLFFYARTLGIRHLVALWAGLMLLASSALAFRWFSVEPGTTHNAVMFFALGGLIAYEKFVQRGRRRHFVFAFLGFALAMLSYPSGILIPMIPMLVEISRVFVQRLGVRPFVRLRPRFKAAVLIGCLAILGFAVNAATTWTFRAAGEGGAVMGTDYGKGALTVLGAWLGGFWTVLPSSMLHLVGSVLQGLLGAPVETHVAIISASGLVVICFGGLAVIFARRDRHLQGQVWLGVFALIYCLGVWAVLASTYLYAFAGATPSEPPYILSAFLLSWGTPLAETHNPYYLLTAPVVLLVASIVMDASITRIGVVSARQMGTFLFNRRYLSQVMMVSVVAMVALGLLIANVVVTAGIIGRDSVSERSKPPFVEDIKVIQPDFPRGASLLIYDRVGLSADLWLWVSHGNARRADRQDEYRALDLGRTLKANVSWYEERFVGRRMSAAVQELYTNIREIRKINISPDVETINVDNLVVDDDIVKRVRTGVLDLDDIYAFVVWDFSTAIDVTEALRARITRTVALARPAS